VDGLLGVSNLCIMVCIILFDEVFYQMVHWEGWSSAQFLILREDQRLHCRCLQMQFKHVWVESTYDYTSLSSKGPTKISSKE
jgi:hypothetical protein